MDSVSSSTLGGDGRSSGSIREGNRVTAERRETVEFTASNGSPALISGSRSCPTRVGLEIVRRCVLPPLIKIVYRRPGEATSHRRAAEYPSRRGLDQQAAAVDRQGNAVDVSVPHQEQDGVGDLLWTADPLDGQVGSDLRLNCIARFSEKV